MSPADTTAAIAEARLLLPHWGPWLIVVGYPALAFFATLLACSLAAFVAQPPLWKCPQTAHWMERARLAFPARAAAQVNKLVLPIAFLLCALTIRRSIWEVSTSKLAIDAGIASYLAAWIAAFCVARVGQQPPITWRRHIQGTLSNLMIFTPHWFVAAVLVAILPSRFDANSACVFIGMVVFYLFLLSGGGIFLARVVGLARPVSPLVRATIDAAAQRACLAPRGAYVVGGTAANALAIPWFRWLLFTSRLLDVLDGDELQAITAHEMAHLGESRRTLLARTVPGVLLLPLAAFRPLAASFGYLAVAAAAIVFLAAGRLFARLYRRMEEAADASARTHQPGEGSYARALEKLYAANLTPAVLGGDGRTHPHLYDRLVAAGVSPAIPRPPIPSTHRYQAGVMVSFATVGLVLLMLYRLPVSLAEWFPGDEDALRLSLAMAGNIETQAWLLSHLAECRWDAGDGAGAVTFNRAASAMDTTLGAYPARLAVMLAHEQRCDEAARALATAEERSPPKPLEIGGIFVTDFKGPPDGAILEARAAVARCGGPLVRVHRLMSAEESGDAWEPNEEEESLDPDEPGFHGSYVIGTFEVVEPRWARLLRRIFDDPSALVGSAADGSPPILGISVGEGPNRIDALVSDQGTRVEVFGGGDEAIHRYLSEQTAAELWELCDEMFPDAERNRSVLDVLGRDGYRLAPVPWNPAFDGSDGQRD
ncbi:MAG TPA: M48 family metalloprotease [Pirellulales bacterium]|nr:M48 family metalloprotease [Pirellulales bacterium]